MKANKTLTLCCAALGLAGAARAESWTVKMQAVNGKVSYSHTAELPVGEQANYAGRARRRGMGPEREIIFNAYLNRPAGGYLRLDYQVEAAGEHPARPPFQAQGKVPLRPRKPVLAAEAGGWKLVFELLGGAEGKAGGAGAGVLETSLKCGGTSYPARFSYLPGEQYNAVLYRTDGDSVARFMVGLLPNVSALDGEFNLQYTLQLKEGGETVAESGGELLLAPGGKKRTARAGKDCVFAAKALR